MNNNTFYAVEIDEVEFFQNKDTLEVEEYRVSGSMTDEKSYPLIFATKGRAVEEIFKHCERYGMSVPTLIEHQIGDCPSYRSYYTNESKVFSEEVWGEDVTKKLREKYSVKTPVCFFVMELKVVD